MKDDASRTRLIALAVLLALSVPLVVIALAGSGGSDEQRGLRVEVARGTPQVVVYLEDPAVNDPATNHGRPTVAIECMDSGGAVIHNARERWPFSDTDGGRFDPHVHVSVPPDQLSLIASCRLKGTDPRLEGPKV